MIWSGLADLHNLFSQYGLTDTFDAALNCQDINTPESMKSLFLHHSRKILQSVAYFTTSEALDSGPPRISTPLSIVVETLKPRKDFAAEYAWAEKVRRKIGERWVRLLNFQV